MTPALNRQLGRVEARAPQEFYALSQVSRGYPLGLPGGFAVTLNAGLPKQGTGFPAAQETIHSPQSGQYPIFEEYQRQEIRLSAYQAAHHLLTIGGQELRLGNIRHGVSLLEEALTLAGNPTIYSNMIRILLELNCPDLARDWAAKGHALFPGNASLSRWNNLLSPPQVRKVPARTTKKIEEVKWLEANSDKFRGKWVVIAGAELVGEGSTLEEALHSAHLKGYATGTLAHRIPD